MCFWVCVNFFFVKDFSGITGPRILQFGTNIGYDLSYCVRDSSLLMDWQQQEVVHEY